MNQELTHEKLKSLLSYDPQTGEFKWLPRPRVGVHRPVGTISHGYLVVALGGRSASGRHYAAHRLAWLYMTGEWPEDEIDHINGDKKDNRFANLREATPAINKQNIRKPKRHNRLGILGVRRYHNKFVAQITVNRQNRYLGLYDTPELAHSAYVDAKREFHEGNTL